MSELAMMAEGSLPRLSQVVARLEQRGWVRRTQGAEGDVCVSSHCSTVRL
jgi:DNA-binding MarR family transcriptional regulator